MLIKRLKRNAGFSILEILIVLGIMTLSMMAMVSLITSNNKTMLTTKITLSRDSVLAVLRFTAAKPAAIANSAANDASNTMLNNCVNGVGGANGCVATTSYPINLLGISGTVVLAGGATPIYYDSSGTICGAVTTNCPLRATASFVAVCPGATATCQSAQSITVSYTVDQNPGANYQGYASLKSQTGTSILQISSIVGGGLGSSSCPVGKCVTGLNADGSLICEP